MNIIQYNYYNMSEKIISFCDKNNIRYVIDDNILYINAPDICKILNIKNTHSSIANYNFNEKKLLKINTNGGIQKCSFITTTGLKKLITKDIADELGIEIIDNYCIPIEISSIQFIMKCFENEKIIHQYNIDNYRVDLYFPVYNIAIECDEIKHRYQIEEDQQCQKYIENKLNCTFIRYSPDKDKLSVANVINKIILMKKQNTS